MENVKTDIIEQIAEAQLHIADMLLEIDDIILQQNPQIEASYALKIGYLENDLLKWQIAARRARRRFALAQARANAGQKFAQDEFEEMLDRELAAWNQQLEKSIEQFLRAAEKAANSDYLSPSESREIKELHRTLVKRLHPDLHPNESDEALRFFAVAQEAYESGNLSIMRALVVATEGMNEEPDDSKLPEDEAAIKLEVVLAHEHVVEQQLFELKNSLPYLLKEFLEDGERVAERVAELREEIENQKAVADAYDKRFEELIGENDGER